MSGKIRLDVFLAEKGFVASREKARDTIINQAVRVDGKTCTRPSFPLTGKEKIEILPHLLPKYVSRGGLKLEKALLVFDIDVKNLTILDIGASTGGFTDCCLQHGAARIFAVDVGHGQLDPSLRRHPQVNSLEGTDIRDLAISQLQQTFVDLIVGDVSFISLVHIFPHCEKFLKKEGKIIFLIKPQFEAGRKWIGKSGIVRSSQAHVLVLENLSSAAKANGFNMNKLSFAPIATADKNIEYLALFSSSTEKKVNIGETVRMAFFNQKEIR